MALAQRPDRACSDFERFHFEGHSLTGAQLLATIEEAPARGLRHGHLPWYIIRLGGLVGPMWHELAEMAYLWQRPHRLDGQALLQAVGPLPSTPGPLALRTTLAAMDFAVPSRTATQGAAA